MLVAAVGGEPWAALPLDGGRAIADPFRPTATLVTLLEIRVAQMPRTDAAARQFPRLARVLRPAT
jgi:hypothetical protein